MEDKSTNYSTRKVGHIVIHWKIHDYVLAKPCYNIISPEFQVIGQNTTKWQLILHPHSYANIKDITLQLQRLDKEPVVVFATWRVIFKDSQDTCLCANGNQNFFKQNSMHEIKIPGAVDIIHDKFHPFRPDVLCIQCQLLVSYKEANHNFKRCSDIGLKSLSRNLLSLYKCGKYSDIEIRVDGKLIRAHKAILQARSPYFKSLIENDYSKDILDLPSLNYEAVEKVLSYLYSGKLEFVLGKPSILIYDCAQRFQIKELKQHYSLDDLFWDSKMNVDDITYQWHIKSPTYFNNHCFRSERLNNLVSNITVRLSLYPRGPDGNSNFLSLIVEVLDVRSQQRVCLEAGILDFSGHVSNESRELWVNKYTRHIILEQFASRDVFDNLVGIRDVLNIGIRLRVYDTEATWRTSISSRMNSFASPHEMEHSYSNLSSDIGYLFTSRIYKDITLIAGCIHFRLHKCILAARSRGLSMKIRKMICSQETSFRLDMKSEICIVLMEYLYSGILKDYKPSDVTELYTVAEDFGIPTLKVICSQILGTNLTVQNVSDVFIFSESKKDEELKLSALKFFRLNHSTVYKQRNWQKLSESHLSLYNEAEEFVRKECGTSRSSASSAVPISL